MNRERSRSRDKQPEDSGELSEDELIRRDEIKRRQLMQRFKIVQKEVQPEIKKVQPIAEVQPQKTEQRIYDLFGSSDEESQD